MTRWVILFGLLFVVVPAAWAVGGDYGAAVTVAFYGTIAFLLHLRAVKRMDPAIPEWFRELARYIPRVVGWGLVTVMALTGMAMPCFLPVALLVGWIIWKCQKPIERKPWRVDLNEALRRDEYNRQLIEHLPKVGPEYKQERLEEETEQWYDRMAKLLKKHLK